MGIEPLTFIYWTSIWVGILTLLIITIDKKKWEKYSKLLFILLVIPISISTIYLAGHTLYKNSVSVTKGPVHWHADFEIHTCNNRHLHISSNKNFNGLDLRNPRGLSNKIGTSLFHEHNDNRIHVEGAVLDYNDISLSSFFKVIGGELSQKTLSYDVENKGVVTFNNKDKCDTGEEGFVQVFINGEKLENFENYILYKNTLVPPGDCIIIEFSPKKNKTKHLCKSWEAHNWNYENFKEKRRELKNG